MEDLIVEVIKEVNRNVFDFFKINLNLNGMGIIVIVCFIIWEFI